MKAVAAKLGIGAAETVRTWVRESQVDTGQRPGVTSEEAAEIKRSRPKSLTASRPNERWVAEFTYVATWSGIV